MDHLIVGHQYIKIIHLTIIELEACSTREKVNLNSIHYMKEVVMNTSSISNTVYVVQKPHCIMHLQQLLKLVFHVTYWDTTQKPFKASDCIEVKSMALMEMYTSSPP